MSGYKSLRVYSYEHPGESIEPELDKRLNGYGTRKFSLIINPINEKEGVRLSDRFNLFLVPINEITQLLISINSKSEQIKNLIQKLPGVASNQFFYQMLVSEIKGTNEIENVSSTTKEINLAIDKINENENEKDGKKKNVRLESFTKLYFSIKAGEVNKIETLDDIRKLYDDLLAGEIPEDKLPDGKLFRDGFVRIGNSTKTVHCPKEHENEIVDQLKEWIEFINDDKIESIIKACVAHYYFEYVHPFYDGNGRLGRYIFCSYVGKKLDPYTAISFSHQVNLNKNDYYKGFKEVENKKNHGEVTLFVLNLLNYLENGQNDVLDRLLNSKDHLELVKLKLEKQKYSHIEFNLLYIYSQAFIFNDFEGSVEDREMYEIFKKNEGISKRNVKTSIDDLENHGLIETVKKKPFKRKITEKFLKEIGIK